MKFYKFLIVTFIFSIIQCNKDNPTPDIIVNVNTEYTIDFKQNLCATGDSLNMIITSARGFNCDNINIQHEFNVDFESKNIDVLLTGVDIPQDCSEVGDYFPSISLPLSNLEEKTYNLNLNLNNVFINNEKITHLAERYFVNFPEKNGVQIIHNHIRKIETDIVWGQISIDAQLDPILLDDLETELFNSAGAAAGSIYLTAGYYSYFNVDDDTVELLDHVQNNLEHHKTVKFKISNSTSFVNKIEALRDQYGNQLILELYTGTGLTY